MTKTKSTKRALLMSALSLLMCVSMLIGSTFAWFTDSVTSGSNVIKSGNLDIVVDYTLDGENWNELDGATDLFQKGLWEPGHTEVVALRIKNNGSLALKYSASMNIVKEVVGKNKTGGDIVLSDLLTVGTFVLEANQIGEAAVENAFENENIYKGVIAFKDAGALSETSLFPGSAHYVIINVDMAESIGNEANHDGKNVPSIEFGINVLATQFTHEEDSFGNQYDVNAWTEVAVTPTPDANGVVDVYSAQQLAGVMANTAGIKVINIKEDIDLNGRSWAPAYVSAPNLVINGNGHTISNMTTNGKDYQGFIGVAYQNLTINDLTFEKATVNANRSFTGGIIGWAWGNADITFNNVDVIDSEVSTTLGNKAIRVGALIGFFPYDGGNLTLKDCDVVGSTVTGYHNVGAMVGTTLTQKTVTIENCTAKNNTLKYGSPQVGAFAFGASTSGYTEYVPASGFTAENNKYVGVVSSTDNLNAILAAGGDVVLDGDIIVPAEDAGSNSYGATGINVHGSTLDGNGNEFGVDKWGTWDSAINITSGTIKNLSITEGFRGVFVNHNGTGGKVYLENVIIDGPIYTISCDQGTNSGLEATNSTFNGWTSYAATIGDVKFTDCSFGEGAGYAFCRPFAPTEFVGCDFEAGYVMDPRAAVTFENCTIDGEPLTAANLNNLVAYNITNATVK